MSDARLTPEVFFHSLEQSLDQISSIDPYNDVYQKILFLIAIDSLAHINFPSMKVGELEKRFALTITEFSSWEDANRYSVPHTVKWLKYNNDPILKDLRDTTKEIHELWQSELSDFFLSLIWYGRKSNPNYQGMLALKNDMPETFVENKLPSNPNRGQKKRIKDIYRFKHKNLLYRYRSALVHKLSVPGLDMRPEEGKCPYYEVYLTKRETTLLGQNDFDLVYPVEFLRNLSYEILFNTKSCFLENNFDPYGRLNSFNLYWFDDMNVDLGLGESLYDLKRSGYKAGR